jgi:hypothetical protein
MSRQRGSDECTTCNRRPTPDDYGRLVCDCPNKFWQSKPSTAGLPEDRVLLQKHGLQLIERPNDIYWVGPYGRILYLYEDGTWFCDTAPEKCTTLEEYLARYSETMREASGPRSEAPAE